MRCRLGRLWAGLSILIVCTLGAASASADAPARPATAPASPPATLPASRPSLPLYFSKPVPQTAADLSLLQKQVQQVAAAVMPAVVGVRVMGYGSGVIVSDDGYVLTAGHVSSAPGRDALILLPDGTKARAKSLGINYGIDSGLLKIQEPGPLPGGKWPCAAIGSSADLKRGQWCIALGHPGGYRTGRTPPLRLGRILSVSPRGIRTDCTLVGGDSGGPLFDLQGRVIAIHSRIGESLFENMHVPVDTYRETWDKLAAGEGWGAPMFARASVYLGIQLDPQARDCRISQVFPDSPAFRAGLKIGDIITRFDGRPVDNFPELMLRLSRKKSGDQTTLDIQRGTETVKLKLTLASRPE